MKYINISNLLFSRRLKIQFSMILVKAILAEASSESLVLLFTTWLPYGTFHNLDSKSITVFQILTANILLNIAHRNEGYLVKITNKNPGLISMPIWDKNVFERKNLNKIWIRILESFFQQETLCVASH